MENFSLTDIKRKNRSDVFHYIYGTPGCSKQNIATALNMSLPTVTQHLTDLLNQQLIEKCGQLSSSIGRKAIAYSVIRDARVSIGIEILENKIYIVGINLYGEKIAKERINVRFRTDPSYFEELKDLVFSFLEKYELKKQQLLGIGLGIQGLASQDGRAITYGEILKSTGLSIDMFQKYFSFPCRFIHDSECAANSELWENPSIKDCVYLSLGDHLGGAVLLDGRLQRGITGKSGTFEHMTLIQNGRTCYCGRRGCAECYCSASALLDGQMELEDFFERKNQGNAACAAKWTEYLNYLSLLINNLHMVMENTIILGGHITPYFTDEDILFLRQKVYELSTFRDPTDYILLGKCRIDAVSIGAALPFITEFLQGLSEGI
ncbi:MAG: ROK family transcriptional regulator [Lachnospiraceae bacterium]|nr:ROK family transcriptional regulator [Lachnospiraceae bacterium]